MRDVLHVTGRVRGNQRWVLLLRWRYGLGWSERGVFAVFVGQHVGTLVLNSAFTLLFWAYPFYLMIAFVATALIVTVTDVVVPIPVIQYCRGHCSRRRMIWALRPGGFYMTEESVPPTCLPNAIPPRSREEIQLVQQATLATDEQDEEDLKQKDSDEDEEEGVSEATSSAKTVVTSVHSRESQEGQSGPLFPSRADYAAAFTSAIAEAQVSGFWHCFKGAVHFKLFHCDVLLWRLFSTTWEAATIRRTLVLVVVAAVVDSIYRRVKHFSRPDWHQMGNGSFFMLMLIAVGVALLIQLLSFIQWIIRPVHHQPSFVAENRVPTRSYMMAFHEKEVTARNGIPAESPSIYVLLSPDQSPGTFAKNWREYQHARCWNEPPAKSDTAIWFLAVFPNMRSVPKDLHKSDFTANLKSASSKDYYVWREITQPTHAEMQIHATQTECLVRPNSVPSSTPVDQEPDSTYSIEWLTEKFNPPIYTNFRYPFRDDPPYTNGYKAPGLCSYGTPVACYRCYFDTPIDFDPSARSISLVLHGCSPAVFIWMNDNYVGYYTDGYLASEFDVTDYLSPPHSSSASFSGVKNRTEGRRPLERDNCLVILVPRFAGASYLEDQDMWRLSGIFRNVELVRMPILKPCTMRRSFRSIPLKNAVLPMTIDESPLLLPSSLRFGVASLMMEDISVNAVPTSLSISHGKSVQSEIHLSVKFSITLAVQTGTDVAPVILPLRKYVEMVNAAWKANPSMKLRDVFQEYKLTLKVYSIEPETRVDELQRQRRLSQQEQYRQQEIHTDSAEEEGKGDIDEICEQRSSLSRVSSSASHPHREKSFLKRSTLVKSTFKPAKMKSGFQYQTFVDMPMLAENPMKYKSEVMSCELPLSAFTSTLLDPSNVEDSANDCFCATSWAIPMSGAVRTWNDESPELYTLTLTLQADGRCVQAEGCRFGFRRQELRRCEFFFNDTPLLVRGVNRHEHHPVLGRVQPCNIVQRDGMLLKQHNFNAVRTSHYPNCDIFYDVCDRLGLYVCSEANLETHGDVPFGWSRFLSFLTWRLTPYVNCRLANDPDWRAAWLGRVARMALRHRNRVCVTFWSLGNEAGRGQWPRQAFGWLKKLDPSRPVQYEPGDSPKDQSDIYCPMYPSLYDVMRYANPVAGCLNSSSGEPERPMILCEYQHAMGNSNGSLGDYWEAFRHFRGLQGGFIWDWVDQAFLLTVEPREKHIWSPSPQQVPLPSSPLRKIFAARQQQQPGQWEGTTMSKQFGSDQIRFIDETKQSFSFAGIPKPQKELQGRAYTQQMMHWAYGGDFGDKPTDNQFSANGLLHADRRPKPALFEAKWCQQPLSVHVANCIGDEASRNSGTAPSFVSLTLELHNRQQFRTFNQFEFAAAAYKYDDQESEPLLEGVLTVPRGVGPQGIGVCTLQIALAPKANTLANSLGEVYPLYVTVTAKLRRPKEWAPKGFTVAQCHLVVPIGETSIRVPALTQANTAVAPPIPSTLTPLYQQVYLPYSAEPGEILWIGRVFALPRELPCSSVTNVDRNVGEDFRISVSELHRIPKETPEPGFVRYLEILTANHDLRIIINLETGNLEDVQMLEIDSTSKFATTFAEPLRYCFYRAPTDNDEGGGDVNKGIISGLRELGLIGAILGGIQVALRRPQGVLSYASRWRRAGLDCITVETHDWITIGGSLAPTRPTEVDSSPGSLWVRVKQIHYGRGRQLFKSSTVFVFCIDGSFCVHPSVCAVSTSVAYGLPPLPRVGLTITVPSSWRAIKYFGNGPTENYIDRKTSVTLGDWFTTAEAMYEPYIVPGEYGGRTNVAWAAAFAPVEKKSRKPREKKFVQGLLVEALPPPSGARGAAGEDVPNANFQFAAQLWSLRELELAKHTSDLGYSIRPQIWHKPEIIPLSHTNTDELFQSITSQRRERVFGGNVRLYFDFEHMGVGGECSWFPCVIEEYLVKAFRNRGSTVTWRLPLRFRLLQQA